MYIKWMHIENYRNLADVTLSFHNDINYFVGENAVGKSNFLDLLEIVIEILLNKSCLLFHPQFM